MHFTISLTMKRRARRSCLKLKNGMYVPILGMFCA
jgi:hypothetical protein